MRNGLVYQPWVVQQHHNWSIGGSGRVSLVAVGLAVGKRVDLLGLRCAWMSDRSLRRRRMARARGSVRVRRAVHAGEPSIWEALIPREGGTLSVGWRVEVVRVLRSVGRGTGVRVGSGMPGTPSPASSSSSPSPSPSSASLTTLTSRSFVNPTKHCLVKGGVVVGRGGWHSC